MCVYVGAFGTLGVGAGFAIAAKLVRPDALVTLLWGDGSSGYSLMEFDTMARLKINVLAIIGNGTFSALEAWRVAARSSLTTSPLSLTLRS